MKKMKISPEWILDKLIVKQYADGKGTITIMTNSVSDSTLIDLALDTLRVKYNIYAVGYDPESEKQDFEFQWEFKIDDIKAECPILHLKWLIMDFEHAKRLYEAQQLQTS
jgi:hypothetical protein